MEKYQLIILVGTNLSIFVGMISSVIALHIHSNKQIANTNKDFNEKIYALEKTFLFSQYEAGLKKHFPDVKKKIGRPKGSTKKRKK